MQHDDSIEFVVTKIGMAAEECEIRLEAKAHPVYTSLTFLHLDPSQLSKFQIGQIYSLVARIELPTTNQTGELIETVPLGGRVEAIDTVLLGRIRCGMCGDTKEQNGHPCPQCQPAAYPGGKVPYSVLNLQPVTERWSDGSPVPAEEGEAS